MTRAGAFPVLVWSLSPLRGYMELVALKKLSNGVKPGQTFVEKHRQTADLLISIGAAQPVTSGMFADDAPSAVVTRPRTRRARRTPLRESAE